MSVQLIGDDRARFARDLVKHRDAYPMKDADYADRVLSVSLNTYKRCINVKDFPELAFKRHTFINIFQRAGLDPSRYGMNITLPSHGERYGGYAEADYPHLAGRFVFHRRSFLTGMNIVRGVLDITWSEQQKCYAFVESLHYVTDSGVPYETTNLGEIHIQKERNLMFLLSCEGGAVRLAMMQIPEKPGAHGASPIVRTRGALLTYGNPRDFYQPIVSAFVLEKRSDKITGDAKKLCATIRPGTPDYTGASAELRHAEEHAVVMTPMLWSRQAPSLAS
jgi:hypothetical protein